MSHHSDYNKVVREAEKKIGRELSETECAAVAQYLAGKIPAPIAWTNPQSQAAIDYGTVCALAHHVYSESRGWPLAKSWPVVLVHPRTGQDLEAQRLSIGCLIRHVSGDAEFGCRAQASGDGGANWYLYKSVVAPVLDR